MIFNRTLNYFPTDIEKDDWYKNPNIVSYRDESDVVGYPTVTPKMIWQEYVKTPWKFLWTILKTIMKCLLLILYVVWVIEVLKEVLKADYSVSGINPGMVVLVSITLAIAYRFRKLTLWEPPYIILWEQIDNKFIAHRYNVNFNEIKNANFSQAQVKGWRQKFIVAYINGQTAVYAEGGAVSDEDAVDFDFQSEKIDFDTNMLFLNKYALETYMLNEPKHKMEQSILFYEKELSGGHDTHVHDAHDTTKDVTGVSDND